MSNQAELAKLQIERTLVLVKPDGVERGLIGDIIMRFEQRGLKVIGLKMVWIDEEFAKKHYNPKMAPILGQKSIDDFSKFGVDFEGTVEELGKKIYKTLIDFITEGPVVAMALEGIKAVSIVRKIVGLTSPEQSQPGTIRGDYAHIALGYSTLAGIAAPNIVHASGTPEEAKQELVLWFKESELFKYKRFDEPKTMGIL